MSSDIAFSLEEWRQAWTFDDDRPGFSGSCATCCAFKAPSCRILRLLLQSFPDWAARHHAAARAIMSLDSDFFDDRGRMV
jgi:hypothetical protein